MVDSSFGIAYTASTDGSKAPRDCSNIADSQIIHTSEQVLDHDNTRLALRSPKTNLPSRPCESSRIDQSPYPRLTLLSLLPSQRVSLPPS